ncbi:fluoride efflux transporter FluC [Parvularcula oceani]|uniref:fluoride efflux transporter FluC n=1 Tax=Parvularcula oceani TaxID=1247963 RepID=UPI0004E1D40A|nr:CrcB family protein [Parvularcula oceani]
MSALSLSAVALGGAAGAVARFGVSRAVTLLAGAEAAWGTLIVNVGGSFGLGLAAILLAERQGPWALFFLVGLFGAFTTFSTFALDAVWLFKERSFALAAAYVAGSVGLALCGFLAGAALGRSFA